MPCLLSPSDTQLPLTHHTPHPTPSHTPARSLYEPVEFIRHFLLDKLEFRRVRGSVAVHVPCSSKKMGIEDSFIKVSRLRL